MIVKELLEKYGGQYSDVAFYYADIDSLRRGYCDYRMGIYEWEDIYEDVIPYSLVFDYELMDEEEYADFSQIPEDCIEGNTLVCVLDKEDGSLPDKSIWEEVEKGNISDEVFANVCRSYGKLAKMYRYNRSLLASGYMPDKEEGLEREQKKDRYYERKDKMLDRCDPVEIHYDVAFKQVYLYCEFGGCSFHRPICKIGDVDAKRSGLQEVGIDAGGLEVNPVGV